MARVRPRSLHRPDEGLVAALAVTMLIGVVVVVSVAAVVMFDRLVVREQEVTPPLSMQADQNGDRLVVSASQPRGDWGRIAIRLDRMTSASFGLCVGGAADPTPTTFINEPAQGPCLDGPNRMTSLGHEWLQPHPKHRKIEATHFMEFCGESSASDVVLKVIDLHATSAIGEFHLNDVKACA